MKPTKEQIAELREKKEWFDLTIDEKCILCGKGNYWDVHIIKIPEWVEMCLDCSEKHRDDKVYTGIEWWRASYIVGKGFTDEYSNNEWEHKRRVGENI